MVIWQLHHQASAVAGCDVSLLLNRPPSFIQATEKVAPHGHSAKKLAKDIRVAGTVLVIRMLIGPSSSRDLNMMTGINMQGPDPEE